MTETYMQSGYDAMMEKYHMLKTEHPDMYSYNEADINMLGYQLVYRNHLNDARKIFELNIKEFPNSANVYDSYGELLLIMGDTVKAVEKLSEGSGSGFNLPECKGSFKRSWLQVETLNTKSVIYTRSSIMIGYFYGGNHGSDRNSR